MKELDDTGGDTGGDGAADSPQEYVRFDYEADFQAAVDRLLEQPGHELRVFDPNLVALKLNSAARVEKLRTFLRRVPHKVDVGSSQNPSVQSIKAKLTSPAPEIVVEARYAAGAAQTRDMFVEIVGGLNVAIPHRISMSDDGVTRFRVDLAEIPKPATLRPWK